MKYWLTVGRFQPLHDGHEALIRSKLDEGKNVIVLIRDTKKSKKNPYSLYDRRVMFYKRFETELYREQLEIMSCPDIEGIFYGRDVGYKVEQVRLDKKTESISGTKIRKEGKEGKSFDKEIYNKPVMDILTKHKDIKLDPNNKEY